MTHKGWIDGVPAMLMRGGTSKGLVFLADDLPSDVTERDSMLLALMGSPDPRQINGLGGAHPLTSKVAIVSRSAHPDADVDYLFLQVSVDEPLVSDRQNCGNMLAAVGPFALDRGLVDTSASGPSEIRIRMINTGGSAIATVSPDAGETIILDFDETAGSATGALLPTGNVVDEIDGVEVTMIDNGMPVVIMTASAMGITGSESPTELEDNAVLRQRLESIRLAAGHLMNLGDVTDTTIPKLTMVAAPSEGGSLNTRTFIPHRCHEAIGVLGAVSVATAALLPGSPANAVAVLPDSVDGRHRLVIEHPTGTFEAAVELGMVDGAPVAKRSGIIRTARKLMDGVAFPS